MEATLLLGFGGFALGGGLGFKFSRNLKISLIAAVVLAVIAALTPHALRHSQASAIADCLNSSGPAMTFYNPSTGRTASLRETSPGKFGVYVWEKTGETVTAFGRENLRHWLNNLVNQGYTLDWASIRGDLVKLVIQLIGQ